MEELEKDIIYTLKFQFFVPPNSLCNIISQCDQYENIYNTFIIYSEIYTQ